MSQWNIAAAQYASRHHCIGEHVNHHLHFISAAADLRCDLLVFPELSLTGAAADAFSLPCPPTQRQLNPLNQAASACNMTVIAGITLDTEAGRQKGLALFIPGQPHAVCTPLGRRACPVPGKSQVNVLGDPDDAPGLDAQAILMTSCLAVGENRWTATLSRLQRFAHRYAIAVLMANARSGSALWDARGQLIVRADQGELLLTGSFDQRGWQGDIIPLR